MSKMPDYLQDAGRTWVKRVLKVYPFSGPDLELLYQAGSCLDTIAAAQKEVTDNGLTVSDRYSVPKVNPASTILRDSRQLFFRACQTLKIIDNGENEKEGEK